MTSAQRNLGILGVGLGEALIAVNFSIVSTALATIQKEFHAGLLEIQWMMNIFGIFMCVCLVLMGRLADAYGRKKIYLMGIVGSGIGSLIAGSAPAAGWIIFAQFIQGTAGAILLAVSQALMSHLFPEDQRSHAIGIWAAIAGITLGIGPLLGGTIIALIGWRWIFFLNIPVAVLAVFVVSRYVEESKSVHHRGEFDVPGCLTLMCSIGSLVLGVMQGPSWGWTSGWSFLCLAIFVISLPLLVYVERRCPYPIIHPEFFLNWEFLLPSMANFCLIFFLWTMFFFLPLYFQQAKGVSPFVTGLILLLATGPVALFSHAVGKLYNKLGSRRLMTIGFCFLALSTFLQFFFQPASPLLLGMGATLFFGIGWVLVWGPSTTAAVSSMPRDVAGIASGAFTTVQEIGATVGLTITGTIFRSSPSPFMDGFRHSLWVLLGITAVGILCSLSIRRAP